LKGSLNNQNSYFGASLAAEGDLLLIGAPAELSNPPDPNNGGAAYLFRRVDVDPLPQWKEVARLVAPAPIAGSRFGAFVALSGDTIAIGSLSSLDGHDVHLFHDLGGDQWVHERIIEGSSMVVGLSLTDEYLAVAGPWHPGCAVPATVYEKGPKRDWTQQCTSAGDTVSFEPPKAVALDGDTLAVVNEPRIDFYSRVGQRWNVSGSIPQVETPFGSALAFKRGRLFVGAPRDASPALGINGNASDQSHDPPLGAVYLFRLSRNGDWVRDAYIKPIASSLKQVAGARFGEALAFADDLLVVGAANYDTSVSAPDAQQGVAPTSGDPAGGAFVYR
jgi:hypothetical protein